MKIFSLIIQTTYILVFQKMIVLQNIVQTVNNRLTERQKKLVTDSDTESENETHVRENAFLPL